MSYNKPIRRIAIVGTGVIGASWAAEYLARGFDVIATDPGPNAEANLRKYIDEAWKDLTSIGLSTGACVLRLDWEETDPFEEGTSWSCRQPAASRALQGDHVSDSARRAER